MALVSFWIFVVLILYSYFGYPLILCFLILLKKKEIYQGDTMVCNYPTVSLIVSAYNEEKVIEDKIRNSLALDYPKDKLQIVVVSDGSTDNTDSIVKRYSSNFDNVKLIRVEGRIGKDLALNKAIPEISGTVVIFSDANSIYLKDAVKNLLRHFRRGKVGCVVGELRYIGVQNSDVSQGESLYWKYESLIKRAESQLGSLLVGNGSIFAIRKELYSTMELNVANDFQIPMEIGAKRYEVIYEPDAIAIEKAAISSKEEFRRKVRIINQGLAGSLNLRRKIMGLRLFQLVSHKLLRWLVAIFLILIFLSNIFMIDSNFYRIFLLLQLSFYGLAGLGAYLQWKEFRCRIFYIPFYFCLVNFAALVALFEFLSGKRYSVWNVAPTTR